MSGGSVDGIDLYEPLYIDGETVECAWPNCDEIAVVGVNDIAFPWLCQTHFIKLRDDPPESEPTVRPVTFEDGEYHYVEPGTNRSGGGARQ